MEPKLITSMYSRAISAMVLAFLVVLVLASSMPSAKAYSGNATYIEYNPEQVNWEWETVNCPELNTVNYPDLNYRQRHRWTEFCGDCGPYTGDCGCHKCLEVTNAATSDDVSVMLRIIEICHFSNDDDDPKVWMDKVAFDQLDTDGQGGASGGPGTAQLKVNYQINDCGDDN